MGGSVQRLTHWSLTAYFYPHAAVKMSPDGQEPPLLIEAPPKPSTSWNLVSTLLKLALWAIPLILAIAFKLESGQAQREVAVLKGASLATPDPVTTTVVSTFTATSVSTSTTISTTISTTVITVGNKWFFAGDSPASSEPTHLPWESTDDVPPLYTSTPEPTPSPTPTESKSGVFEASKEPSPWSSIDLELPSSREMTEHLRWAIVKLWKLVLQAYHYPLDPP